MEKQQKIAVAGMGYVGLSNAALLARDNPVCAVDIQPEKVDKVNRGRSPIADPQLESRLGEKGLMLSATTDIRAAYGDADFVIIATPTDYDAEQNYFDTSSVEGRGGSSIKDPAGRLHCHKIHGSPGVYKGDQFQVPGRMHPVFPGISKGRQGSL